MTFNLLNTLSILIVVTGLVAVVLGAFRASVWWGLAVFFSPLIAFMAFVFGGSGSQQGMIALIAGVGLTVAAWLGFFIARWKDARQGVLVVLIGGALSAATWWLYAPPEMQAKAWMAYQAMRNRLPWLPQAGDDAPAASTAANPAGRPAIEQVPWPSSGPTTTAASSPAASGPAVAVSAAAEAEVRRTLARLNDDAQKLAARREKLTGSRDAAAVRQLGKDIEEYNAQRAAALKRAADLKIPIGDAQPAASPTPAASPAKKTK